MKLSDHFTLEEFTETLTGLPNQPDAAILPRLILTASKMEDVRAFLGGKPIKITSGYRSPAVNDAVGGSKTSAHSLGYAVDFKIANMKVEEICKLINANPLIKFDQLIDETRGGRRWVHISFDPRNRRQFFKMVNNKRV